MTEFSLATRQKAADLLNAEREKTAGEYVGTSAYSACNTAAGRVICTLIDQHEAFRLEVSDDIRVTYGAAIYPLPPRLARHVLPKPDPIEQAILAEYPDDPDRARRLAAQIRGMSK